MKFLLTEEVCDIPEKVSVKVRARVVEVNNSLYFFPLIVNNKFQNFHIFIFIRLPALEEL